MEAVTRIVRDLLFKPAKALVLLIKNEMCIRDRACIVRNHVQKGSKFLMIPSARQKPVYGISPFFLGCIASKVVSGICGVAAGFIGCVFLHKGEVGHMT